MKNLKLIWLVLLTICWAGNILGQKVEEKPNFSGTWVLDVKKSAVNPLLKGGNNEKKLQCLTKLIIGHNALVIMFNETTECKMPANPAVKPLINETKSTYFTDERGEKNGDSESKTQWKGQKIFVTFYKTDKNGKNSESLVRELSLSKDGKTLTIKSDNASTFGAANIGDITNFSKSVLVYTLSN